MCKHCCRWHHFTASLSSSSSTLLFINNIKIIICAMHCMYAWVGCVCIFICAFVQNMQLNTQYKHVRLQMCVCAHANERSTIIKATTTIWANLHVCVCAHTHVLTIVTLCLYVEPNVCVCMCVHVYLYACA